MTIAPIGLSPPNVSSAPNSSDDDRSNSFADLLSDASTATSAADKSRNTEERPAPRATDRADERGRTNDPKPATASTANRQPDQPSDAHADAPPPAAAAAKPSNAKAGSDESKPTDDTAETAPGNKPDDNTKADAAAIATVVADSVIAAPPPVAIALPDTAATVPLPVLPAAPVPAAVGDVGTLPAPALAAIDGRGVAPIAAPAPSDAALPPPQSATPQNQVAVDFRAALSAGAAGPSNKQSDGDAKAPAPSAPPVAAAPTEQAPKPLPPGLAGDVPIGLGKGPDPVPQEFDQSTAKPQINPLLARLFDPSAGGDNNIRVSLTGSAQAVGNGAPRSLLSTGAFTAASLASADGSTAGSGSLAQLAAAIQPTDGGNAANLGNNVPASTRSSDFADLGSSPNGGSQPFSALLGPDSIAVPTAATQATSQLAAASARNVLPYVPAAEQIAAQFAGAFRNSIDQIRIHLQPAELGHVDVKLELHRDGSVQAVISAQRQDTLDILQRDAKTLERALQDSGLKTDSGSLSFNLRGDGGDASGNAGRSFGRNPGAGEPAQLTQQVAANLPSTTARPSSDTGLNILV